MKAIVVGNAGTLRGSGLGPAIDAHDAVVRCNYFRTEGHEPDVGSKTTHWILIANRSVAGRLPETDCATLAEVWLRFNGQIDSYERVRKRLKNARRIERVRSWDAFEGFPQWTADRKRLTVPTTGILAIVKALDRWGPVVNIAGFGPRSETPAKLAYYWGQVYCSAGSCHDYGAERLLINDWETARRIRRLDG